MAQVTNTFSRYDAVGIRESLSDIIHNISPTDTPAMSNAGKETVEHTDFEWQTDALAATDTANAHIEGDDITSYDAVVPTVRLKNYTQISRKTAIISGTNEATNRAGRKREMSYQMAKKSKELKRDMEAIITANQAKVAGDDSTARKTGSLLSFIATNDVFQTGGGPSGASPTGDGSDARTDNSATAAFTETMLKSAIQLVWAQGGTLRLLMVGGTQKQAVSAFAGIAGQRFNAAGAKPSTIIGAADVYVSDFGNLSIVPNRFMRSRDALILDPDLYSICYLRPFASKPLATTGDAEKRLLIVEWGLKVKQEKGLGGVFDLT